MDIARITPREVAHRLDRGERIAFLDSRSAKAMERATDQIPGSLRVPPEDIDRRAPDVPRATTLVAYCT